MKHILYSLPLGASSREEFLAQAAADGDDGAGSVLLLPSSLLLHHTREELRQRQELRLDALHLLSFDDLVQKIVQQSGQEREFINRMTQEMLMQQVLEDLAAAGRLPYFSRIASFPGYVRVVTSLIGEIKRTGVSPDEFCGVVEMGELAEKNQEICAIYSAYQASLAALGLADLEEMYLLALAALDREDFTPLYTRIFLSEFYVLTPLQLELVRRLRNTAEMHIAICYEKNRPSLYGAVENTYTALVGMNFEPVFSNQKQDKAPGIAHLERYLFETEGPAAVNAEGLSLTIAPDRAKVMRRAAAYIKRQILEQGYSPADFAIVVRDTDAYVNLRGVLQEFGLPVSLPQEESLTGHAVTRTLINCMKARLENGSRVAVKDLAKSPLVQFRYDLDGDELENFAANYVIRNWQDWQAICVKPGEDQAADACRDGIRRLYELAARMLHTGACGDFVQAVRDILAELEATERLVAQYRAGRLPLPLLSQALKACQAVLDVLDGMARGFVLLGMRDRRITLAEFLSLFQQSAAEQTVQIARRDPAGVQVLSPSAARGITFPIVMVLGLSEGEFPHAERENWLFTERERQLLNDLGVFMPTLREKRRQEDLYFGIAIALARQELHLYSVQDSVTLPSPYIEDVSRLFASQCLPVAQIAVSEQFPKTYEEIYSMRDFQGKVLTDAFPNAHSDRGGQSSLLSAVFQTLGGGFERRVAAQSQRNSSDFGIYEGVMQDPAARQLCRDLAMRSGVLSITALEDYARCPFGYFIGRILDIANFEEQEEDTASDVTGSIYHETLAAFFRPYRGKALRPENLDRYEQELIAVFRDICRQRLEAGEIFDGKVWRYEAARMEQTLGLWLRFEVQEQNQEGLAFRPAFLEWGFGVKFRPGMDEDSVAEPLLLEADGEQIPLGGKVDRIDRTGDKWLVMDYKKSRCPSFRDIEAGLDLQAPLYILAVEHFLAQDGGQAVGGGYNAIEGRTKDGGLWREEYKTELVHRAAKRSGNLTAEQWEETLAKVRQLVKAYADGIREGRFPVSPPGGCAPYCRAASICRYSRYQKLQADDGGDSR